MRNRGLSARLLLVGQLIAGVTASISGTVTDATGAVVVGATVTATNVETGVATTQATNGQGFYSFQALPLGTYTLDVQQTGFKAYRQTGLVVDVSSALVVDVSLQVGAASEKVEVSSAALHVDTESTQMGEVITGKEMVDVPLVSRSYTDLLTLQPGVAPTQSQLTGAGAIPNLDSLHEFRILTNNFDAEYGNYSGGLINVVTKSGTNQYHGNLFEFLRNTDFDAANFFDHGSRGAYHQNQFGGTFGGPVIKDKIFFFGDYQGNRLIQGVTQVIKGAPTSDLLGGNLASLESQFVKPDPNNPGSFIPTTVQGAAFAQQLTNQFSMNTGQVVHAGENYFVPGCTPANCVFPNGTLPTGAFNPISMKLLPFILPANGAVSGVPTFTTNSKAINLHDNKFSLRGDANTRFGLLTAYYYYDKYDRIDPYWPGNAPVYPGFNVDGKGQTHNITLGDTKTINSSSVNELRIGYFRLDTKFNQPQGGTSMNALANLGFASGANRAPGIFPLVPALEGVPEIDFNNFVIGGPSRPNGLLYK